MKARSTKLLTGLVVFGSFALHLCVNAAPTHDDALPPIVLSVQMEHGKPLYKLNGKAVEDRRDNSLLDNLAQLANNRGNRTEVWVVVDERAPFREAGKLQTALDKVDMPNRKLFIADFPDGTMNEIRWQAKSVPIPPN